LTVPKGPPAVEKHVGLFATTHWSVVLAAGQTDAQQAAEALEALCRTYWYPVYAFLLRSGHDMHTAKDLTPSFFLRLLGRNDFATIHPDKGRFRSFLLTSLKHFLINERFRANAEKRGGGRVPIPLDELVAQGANALEPSDNLTPEKLFDRRWALALFDRVLARLREEYARSGRGPQFDLLKNYLTEEQPEASQAELGRTLGLTKGSVKVIVHRLRGRYRELLREEVAQTVANASDVKQELRDLVEVLR
jgi:RNA polymerase sigma-70 factor (ECF subfamily)